MTQEFNTQERRRILAFVREVIDRELHNAPMPDAPEIPGLDERRSCFVTLHDCCGNLRGTLR